MTASPNSRQPPASVRRSRAGVCVILLALAALLTARPVAAQSDDAIGSLPDTRVDTIGVLDLTLGGLPPDLWRGSDIRVIERLFEDAAATSPTTWSILRLLALSRASPPVGDPGGTRLLGHRAALLWRLGDLNGIGDLAEAATLAAESGLLRRLNAERLFLVGADFEACQIVEVEGARDDAAYWQSAQVACQALVGDRAKADLGLALSPEVGGVEETALALLIGDVLFGKERKAPPRPVTTGYELALAGRAKTPVDFAGVPNEPALMAAIAAAPWVGAPTRIAAAERIVHLGGPVDRLRALYTGDSVAQFRTFANGDHEPAGGDTWPIPRRRPTPQDIDTVDISSPGALYRAVVGARQNSDRARALDLALAAARQAGTLLTAARLYAPWLDGLPISEVTAPLALNAARAQLSRHRYTSARQWLALASRSARQEADRIEIKRLAAIGDLTGGTTTALTSLPFDAESLRAIAPTAADQALLLGVADAVGADIPGEFWLPLLETPAGESSSRLTMAKSRLVKDAADTGRRGEAILVAIGLLGPEGPRGAAPEELALAVEVLISVGLSADARALAAEALAVRL